MTDIYTKAQRSRMMSRVRSKGTELEREVSLILRGAGLRYLKNQKRLPGRPDFLLRDCKVVLFAHGCFWHGHTCPRARLPDTRKRFWKDKIAANVRRDRRVARQLRTLGFSVLTIWACQVKNSRRVVRRLATIVECKKQ